MVERENGYPNHFKKMAAHLSRFYDGDCEQALMEIEKFVSQNPDASPPQIFNTLAYDLGIKKSHMSGMREGSFRASHKMIGRGGRKRW